MSAPREKENWSPKAVNVEARYNTKESWVGNFFECGITPDLFADGGSIAFDVEQVVGNLIRPADVVAITFEGLHLFGSTATEETTNSH